VSYRSRGTALGPYTDPDAGVAVNSTARVASTPTPGDVRRRNRELRWVWVAVEVSWGTDTGSGGMGCSRGVRGPRGRDMDLLRDPDPLGTDPQLLAPPCA
jgi:hypothetical protein